MAGTSANCQSCNRPLTSGTAFCVHCGAPVVGMAPPPPPPPAAETPPSYSTPPPGLGTVGFGGPGPESHIPLTHRGFLPSLFDLSFTSLVATKIIKVLYAITILLIGLTALGFIVAAFHQSSGTGVIVLLILAPLFSLFYIVCARVYVEIVIALFRIMENTGELVAQGKQIR